ncbi:cAMP-dependent protein kinase catalytic subunit PRKX-like [Condylostylus longicornis]|uniref:cAMP-dependent protein kinase catalytic subunit PRKX-like n=1 Tax=Condylostylus longicornis TaxID=2530218 RepID=UPI00244E0550|nr:cAMP-dependent protein kinase catalytic subunit PRKX-like [Condylostylus longicornis]
MQGQRLDAQSLNDMRREPLESSELHGTLDEARDSSFFFQRSGVSRGSEHARRKDEMDHSHVNSASQKDSAGSRARHSGRAATTTEGRSKLGPLAVSRVPTADLHSVEDSYLLLSKVPDFPENAYSHGRKVDSESNLRHYPTFRTPNCSKNPKDRSETPRCDLTTRDDSCRDSNDLFESMSPVKVPDISKPSRSHQKHHQQRTQEKPATSLSEAVEAVRRTSHPKSDVKRFLDAKPPVSSAVSFAKRGSTTTVTGSTWSRKTESVDSFNDFLLPPTSRASGRRSTITNFLKEEAEAENVPVIKLIFDSKPKLRLSDFELNATVGAGTFGRVRMCKLKHCEDRSPLALKILKKSEVIRLKQVEHVKSEKDILKRIHHPFIVNLYATFQDSRRLFMVMEFVHGGELFSYLKKEGRLDNAGGRFYASEITVALQYLHSLDIAYRDLKPENLLIDGGGHVKITDFGFAKVVKDRTWTVCGTPEYLAPEVIQSKGHGKSVDWWALGILIYEMLAGYPPFFDENPFGIYEKVLAGKINFPRYIDIRAKDLIKRLLSHDRAKRFGCLKGGAEDIKRHKWFKSLDWTKCIKQQLTPPFVPSTACDDTSMFDKYPESSEGSAPSVSSAEQELFADF